MKRPKDPTLKDMGRPFVKSEIESLKRELARRRDSEAEKLLGKAAESYSIQAISGGRPESNRRKF